MVLHSMHLAIATSSGRLHNVKMQASCRRRFLTWQVSRGNRLILVVMRKHH